MTEQDKEDRGWNPVLDRYKAITECRRMAQQAHATLNGLNLERAAITDVAAAVSAALQYLQEAERLERKWRT